MRHVGHERRAAHHRAVLVPRREPQVFAQRRGRHAALAGGGEHAVDVGEGEAAVRQRALHALRHQIDDAHVRGDFAEVRFGHADDRGGAAREAGVHASATGSKTG
jgi:hypothetical protein